MLRENIDCVGLQALERCFRDLPDVVGPTVETIASAVRVDAKSKFCCNHYAIPERRKRFSHQLFVRERTVRLSGVKEGHAAFDGGTNDLHALLSLDRRPVIGAQPHAAEAKGRHLNAAFSQLPLDRKSTRLNSSHPSISYAVF